MKYIAYVLVGSLLMAGTAFAAVKIKGIQLMNATENGSEVITKYYDYDSGVVCYAASRGSSEGGISCIKTAL